MTLCSAIPPVKPPKDNRLAHIGLGWTYVFAQDVPLVGRPGKSVDLQILGPTLGKLVNTTQTITGRPAAEKPYPCSAEHSTTATHYYQLSAVELSTL